MDALNLFLFLVFVSISAAECNKQSSDGHNEVDARKSANKTAQTQLQNQNAKLNKATTNLGNRQTHEWTRSIAHIIGSLVDEYANFVNDNVARTRSHKRSPASYWYSAGVRRGAHDGDERDDDERSVYDPPPPAVYEVARAPTAGARRTRHRTPPPSYHSYRSYPSSSSSYAVTRRLPQPPPPAPAHYDYYEPSSAAADQLVDAFYGSPSSGAGESAAAATGGPAYGPPAYESAPEEGDHYEPASASDLWLPLESREVHHHRQHGHEVKEVSYVYPILVALLILGALFVPFISLFLFLAVSAFNCHQLGSSGFASVTPIFGKRRRRRRRRKRSFSSELDEINGAEDPISLTTTLPAARNRTRLEAGGVGGGDDDDDEDAGEDLRFMFRQQHERRPRLAGGAPKARNHSAAAADLWAPLESGAAPITRGATRAADAASAAIRLAYALGPLLSESLGVGSTTISGFDSDPNYEYHFGFVSTPPPPPPLASGGASEAAAHLDALVDGLDRLRFADSSALEPSADELVYWRIKLAQTSESLRNALLEFGDEHL